MARGSDLVSRLPRTKRTCRSKYDVGGILLARPFKIVKHGPVNLFVEDIERAVDCYHRHAGLHRDGGDVLARRSLRLPAQQHRASFARALPDGAAPEARACRADTHCMARSACKLLDTSSFATRVAFLKKHGVRFLELPPEMSPGMDHTVCALDPDGHCDAALLLDGADRLGRKAEAGTISAARSTTQIGPRRCSRSPTPSTASRSWGRGRSDISLQTSLRASSTSLARIGRRIQLVEELTASSW